MFKDYYQILQVHYCATKPVVKAAFKQLSHLNHPDKGGIEGYFIEIKEAYEILSDTQKRQAYNKLWMDHMVHQSTLNMENLESSLYDVTFYHIRLVMMKYLELIQKERYEEAYNMLSPSNQKHVFLKDFIMWQKLITEIHHLLEFQCVIEEIVPRNLENKSQAKVRVRVKEYNKLFNRVEEDYFSRYLVYERHAWCVKLNNIDVKKVIRKYKKILMMKKNHARVLKKYLPRIDENHTTKLVSKKYFINNCEYEWLRYQRYERIFSILSIRFNDIKADLLEGIIRNETRMLDSFTRFYEDHFFILLPETSKENGKKVARKILKSLAIKDRNHLDFRITETSSKYENVKEMLDRLRSHS